MSIGLKGCMKPYKGCYLRNQIIVLFRELKYAWQRAWRGWDDKDVWSMNTRFIERYIEILRSYRKSHHGLMRIPQEYQDKYEKQIIS